MARRKQKNKYLIDFQNGSTITLTASLINEAKNLAMRMGEAVSVQRVYKSQTKVCKVHTI